MGNIIKSCYNCKHCIAIPRNNRYNDIDYLCVVNSYFTIDIHKDISRIKHFTPGGRKLECKSVSLPIGKMRLQSIKFDEMRIYKEARYTVWMNY